MLTLDELQSTQQTAYEQHLDGLGEDELRDLLDHEAKLSSLAPPHLSYAESRSIAEAALAEVLARKTALEGESPPPAETQSAIGRLLSFFWTPFR